MIHSSEHGLQAAREVLSNNQIKHLEICVPEAKPNFNLPGSASVNDVWVVSYTYMVFEEEVAFIYLDDRNGLQLLYILSKHGYVTY